MFSQESHLLAKRVKRPSARHPPKTGREDEWWTPEHRPPSLARIIRRPDDAWEETKIGDEGE